jgi:hypothetical protein
MDSESLEALANRISYVGSPYHKRHPGNFGITPRVHPRMDRYICDIARISDPATASSLLQDGVRRGLVSSQRRGGLPQNVWAVTPNGTPVEAQLDNQGTGTYHGYPMGLGDPLTKKVVERWNEIHGDK